MASKNTNQSIFKNLDWVVVILFLLLVIAGAISIYAASYDFDHASIFDFSEFSGKQIRWIGCSILLGLVLLLIEKRMYETYAYYIYIVVVFLLLVTIFVAPEINGSHSWLVLGPMNLQPAEFGKFATALALAKLFSSYNFTLNAKKSNYFKAIAIIFIPIMLILAQNETGSALVYFSLIFVLYREGMSGLILYSLLFAIVTFVVTVKFSSQFLGLQLGEFIALVLTMVSVVGTVAIYAKAAICARNLAAIFLSLLVINIILNVCGVNIPGIPYFVGAIAIGLGYCIFEYIKSRNKRLHIPIVGAIISVLFMFSVNYVFNNALQPHQQMRIKVLLGMEKDLLNAGYNVNQAKIAIGSGGLTGKGFLEGTQTKLKYVPEQHTDFIFCTIGEEQGFIGSVAVLLLFLALILRIIRIAERQPSAFGRVYAYCVVSYLIFHIGINIGMVIGYCPVIGIPLPFFSYGGSSLWGFTVLLFVLLRIDASRRDSRNY